MNKFLLLFLAFIVTGCAHQLELISRDNGGNGSGVAQEAGKQITIQLNGETYKGTYVYDGGSAIFTNTTATATAYSGNKTAIAYGNGVSSSYVPGSGNGKIFATSGTNSLHCDFMYKSGSGLGYCKDNHDKEYDLLIH